MRRINFSSGDNTPSNDVVRLNIAMEADSQSSIYLQYSGGKTLLSYATNSDYVFNVERFGRFSGEYKTIDPSYSNNIGYESGICWVPGKRIASNSESSEIPEDLNAPLLSDKNYFSDEEVEKKNTIILDDYYGESWLDNTCYMSIGNIKIIPDQNGRKGGQGPFIEVVEPSVQNTGELRIYSSDLNSSVFSFEIKKDLKANVTNPNYSNPTRRKRSRINYGNKSLEGFIEEWNSIFSITDNANINSKFRDGTNVDQYFIKELKAYMNQEWDGKMQKYLWERATVDSLLELNTNDPATLKNVIFNQIKNYGASDDVKKISEKYNMNLSWHMGIGGVDADTSSRRKLLKSMAYMPDLECFKSIYKVGGFPPRGAFFANIASNVAMSQDLGTIVQPGGLNSEINILNNSTDSANNITDSGNTY